MVMGLVAKDDFIRKLDHSSLVVGHLSTGERTLFSECGVPNL